MFDITDFNSAEPGEIIRTVTTKYQNVHTTDQPLTFVVVKGDSGLDWAIYCHYSYQSVDFIRREGDKVTSKENIMSIFPCTEEVYKLYRF